MKPYVVIFGFFAAAFGLSQIRKGRKLQKNAMGIITVVIGILIMAASQYCP
jgi:hypothetical protein